MASSQRQDDLDARAQPPRMASGSPLRQSADEDDDDEPVQEIRSTDVDRRELLASRRLSRQLQDHVDIAKQEVQRQIEAGKEQLRGQVEFGRQEVAGHVAAVNEEIKVGREQLHHHVETGRALFTSAGHIMEKAEASFAAFQHQLRPRAEEAVRGGLHRAETASRGLFNRLVEVGKEVVDGQHTDEGGGDPFYGTPEAPLPPNFTRTTVKVRVGVILKDIHAELVKYKRTDKWTGLAINGAIGAQVLLGTLITAISAAASPRGAQISTSILGGATTVVAGYLARARGSGEPEISRERIRDLDQLYRSCKNIELDFGNEMPSWSDPNRTPHDEMVLSLIDQHRAKFEELINTWNGQKQVPEAAPPPKAS